MPSLLCSALAERKHKNSQGIRENLKMKRSCYCHPLFQAMKGTKYQNLHWEPIIRLSRDS